MTTDLKPWMSATPFQAYARGLRDAVTWLPIESAPKELPRAHLVANAKDQVCMRINGVIHNVPGSPWDWDFGEPVTHWMAIPVPPTTEAPQ